MASKKARGEVDRISSLPDSLLIHILSVLPTEDAVRTRVLSTRWKHLYTFLPHFSFEFFPGTDSRLSRSGFIHFVNSVLFSTKLLRMIKFRLVHQYSFDEYSLLDSWICFVLWLKVREIEIIVHPAEMWLKLPMPYHIFCSETLTVLKLGCFKIMLPDRVHLPCLKTFHLFQVELCSASAQRLFVSCPVLQDLAISGCYSDEETINIASPVLDRLTIHELDDEQLFFFEINAPNLSSFEYAQCGYYDGEFSRSLLNATCHVQHLYMLSISVEAYQKSGISLPLFPNLKSLAIGPTIMLGADFLIDFLDKSPGLEFLTFVEEDVGAGYDEIEQSSYSLPDHVPHCVSNHIKQIEFRHFFGLWNFLRFRNLPPSECNLKLAEYFLKNAAVLDKMKILSSSTNENSSSCFTLEDDIIAKKLLAFQRCSRDCKIVFESIDTKAPDRLFSKSGTPLRKLSMW